MDGYWHCDSSNITIIIFDPLGTHFFRSYAKFGIHPTRQPLRLQVLTLRFLKTEIETRSALLIHPHSPTSASHVLNSPLRALITISMTQSFANRAGQQQRVVIENSHGEKLVGILHETGSKELVILCHGFQSTKERIPMVNLAAALEKEGISAFRFDFAGNGESEGSFQYGNYRREAQDLHSVVQHFQGEKRVISAVIGHSKGGNVVLLYASQYNDVHTVVNISGRFDLERGMEGRLGKDFLQRLKQHGYIDVTNRKGKFEYRVTEESLKDRLTTDNHTVCLLIQHECRVLTVHGSMDKIVPVEDALEFAKFIPNHKLHIMKGADHEYTSHQDELASVVLDFLREDFDAEKDMPRLPLKDHSFRSRL